MEMTRTRRPAAASLPTEVQNPLDILGKTQPSSMGAPDPRNMHTQSTNGTNAGWCTYLALERLYTCSVLSGVAIYTASLLYSTRSGGLPTGLLSGLWVSCLLTNLVIYARLVNGGGLAVCRACLKCKKLTDHSTGNIDMRIMKEILADPPSMLAMLWMTLLVVVDVVAPRTAASVVQSVTLWGGVMTIVISDAFVQESRSFIRFNAMILLIFLTAMMVLALLGKVEDVTLFTLSFADARGQQDNNSSTDGNATTTPCREKNMEPTETDRGVTYTRTGVKRIIFIQIYTFMFPALRKVLCRSTRTHMMFLEKPVPRWNIMNANTLQTMSQRESDAQLKIMSGALKNALTRSASFQRGAAR